MLLTKPLLLILFYFLPPTPCLDLSLLHSLSRHFSLSQISILCSVHPKEARTINASPLGAVKLLTEVAELDKSRGGAVICADEVPLGDLQQCFRDASYIATKSPWLFLSENATTMASLMQALELNIDQRVFFVDLGTGSVHESYEVNNVSVSRQIASVSINDSYEVKVSHGMGNFLQRRSDFMGRIFKVVLDQQVRKWNSK